MYGMNGDLLARELPLGDGVRTQPVLEGLIHSALPAGPGCPEMSHHFVGQTDGDPVLLGRDLFSGPGPWEHSLDWPRQC